ncbi:hypothetical protein L1887_58856 [Cichorium endivia]|nr:hypothetical protein L1887_58856 [Cichorium endivia]
MDAHNWMWDVHVRFLAVRLLAPPRRTGSKSAGEGPRDSEFACAKTVWASWHSSESRTSAKHPLKPADHRPIHRRNPTPAALVSTRAIVEASLNPSYESTVPGSGQHVTVIEGYVSSQCRRRHREPEQKFSSRGSDRTGCGAFKVLWPQMSGTQKEDIHKCISSIQICTLRFELEEGQRAGCTGLETPVIATDEGI